MSARKAMYTTSIINRSSVITWTGDRLGIFLTDSKHYYWACSVEFLNALSFTWIIDHLSDTKSCIINYAVFLDEDESSLIPVKKMLIHMVSEHSKGSSCQNCNSH